MFKKLKPKFFWGSRVPGWLGKILPFKPDAVSFLCFVWVRYPHKDRRLQDHETIHFQQQLELLFVLQWLLYSLFYLKRLYDYRNVYQAYLQNPFEREAYSNEGNRQYLEHRPRFAWYKYI